MIEFSRNCVRTLRAESQQVLTALRNQVEYYLSKENLAGDQFLVQKMDASCYVDLAVLADVR